MQSSKSQHYLNQCIQAAEKSTMSFTLGAVLVKGGKRTRLTALRTNYDGSWNSNKRNKRTNGTDIYVVRVASGTTPVGSARPCARCLFWCYWAGIRRVFYWDASAGGFVSVKPLEVDIMAYVTQADRKIADGSFEFI
ncbi:deoxycytidylate deaminase (dCMP deaminase) [Ceratobasidium sp. AG-Ba]|nr:deoxycytidylate deaminase (dCMP deaminase) [Ceratobasidium sp. AG-Ba]